MDYRDQLVLTGELNDVGAPIRTNVDKSYRAGIEAEAMFSLSPKFTWAANLTLSRNQIDTFNEVLYDYGADFDEYIEVVNQYKNTDISFSPNAIAGSIFSFLPWPGSEFSLLTKYVGSQYLDNTSTSNRSINAYMTNDLRLKYSIAPKGIKEIGFHLLVNNIFNVEYESNGYTYGYFGGGEEFRENYFYPQAGRNFMAMVTVRF
jgi:iron complex outermembrane recepter protein